MDADAPIARMFSSTAEDAEGAEECRAAWYERWGGGSARSALSAVQCICYCVDQYAPAARRIFQPQRTQRSRRNAVLCGMNSEGALRAPRSLRLNAFPWACPLHPSPPRCFTRGPWAALKSHREPNSDRVSEEDRALCTQSFPVVRVICEIVVCAGLLVDPVQAGFGV